MVQPVKLIAFFLVMMAYWYVPISTITQQERILDNGTLYKFRPEPVDPYDAFRGRFIWVNLPTEALPVPSEEPPFTIGQKAYAILARDSADFAYFAGLSHYRPQNQDYIQVNIQNIGDQRTGKEVAWITLPESLEKYYLNEKLAPKAEETYNKLLRNRQANKAAVVANVKVWKGKALLEQLYFENQKMEEYLKGQ